MCSTASMPQLPQTQLSNATPQNYPADNWSDYEELMSALKRGCEQTVNSLLDNNCRVVRPGTLNTPLHLAVEKPGWTNVIQRLLEHGARVDFCNGKGDTALHHAFIQEASDVIINRMLMTYLKKGHENLVNANGITYLHIACAKSKLACAKEFLVMAGVDVNAQIRKYIGASYAGYTALHFAVSHGKFDIAALLLKAKANIYASDAGGSTPLHLACRRRDVKMIDLLLSYDQFWANYIDKHSTSHFMAACMSTNLRYPQQYLVVAYHQYKVSPLILVSEVTNPFTESCSGYTPLHFAAEWGRLEIVELLLTYGAFCCSLNAKNETPFMLAQKHSHIEVCAALKQHCDNFQARMAHRTVEVAQVEDSSLGESNSKITEVESLVDDESQQNCSSPDTVYCSAPPSLGESNLKITEVESLVNDESHQNCSSPDTVYCSAPPSCEQRATHTPDCQYDFIDEFEAAICCNKDV